MVSRFAPRLGRGELKRVKRQLSRDGKLASPVLMVHSQRLAGFLDQMRLQGMEVQNPAPRTRGGVELPSAPAEHRVGSERLGVGTSVRAWHVSGSGERSTSFRQHRTTLIKASNPDGFARRSGSLNAPLKKLRSA